MAGGYGNRLYPLSTPKLPKQFISFIDGESFFQKALYRASSFADEIIVTANFQHKDLIESQIKGYHNVKLQYESEPNGTYEPIRKIVSAANDDRLYLILQSDHYYKKESMYTQVIKKSIDEYIPGTIVLHAMEVFKYEEGFGYISRSNRDKTSISFIEKPSLKLFSQIKKNHETYLHLGNTIFQGSTFLSECEIKASSPNWDERTIETTIFSNSKNLKIHNLDVGWVDIGTWKNLIKILPKDRNHNFASPGIKLVNCSECIAIKDVINGDYDFPLIIEGHTSKIFIVRDKSIIKILDIQEC